MIVVVDYGMGNLRSVAKALQHVAPAREVVISDDADVIRRAERVVLPGQSAMPEGMAGLRACGLHDVVLDVIADRPFLGVCLGLQMLFGASEEGPSRGLGVLPGRVVRFRDEALLLPGGARLKVPHMGWNEVRQARPHPLWQGIPDRTRFYFAHSFHAVPDDPDDVGGTAAYPAPFTCAVARANIFAVQFHPEKSHRAGLTLLANFANWDGRVS